MPNCQLPKKEEGTPYHGGSKAVTGRTADDQTPSNLMTFLFLFFLSPDFYFFTFKFGDQDVSELLFFFACCSPHAVKDSESNGQVR
jgi:hypothetical protein